MEQEIIDLWANIGPEGYWSDLLVKNPGVFVPFSERWPQPGFIGGHYFDSDSRVVVMGQNPRASNTSTTKEADMEMFRLIRNHSQERSAESIAELFSMMRNFMLGMGYGRAWTPITAVRRHLSLDLDSIAYLNLIPLATSGDRIVPAFEDAYQKSTMLQLKSLNPDKVVVFGKGAYDRLDHLGGTNQYDTRYAEERVSGQRRERVGCMGPSLGGLFGLWLSQIRPSEPRSGV